MGVHGYLAAYYSFLQLGCSFLQLGNPCRTVRNKILRIQSNQNLRKPLFINQFYSIGLAPRKKKMFLSFGSIHLEILPSLLLKVVQSNNNVNVENASSSERLETLLQIDQRFRDI